MIGCLGILLQPDGFPLARCFLSPMASNLSRYVACSLLVPAALVASYVLASSPIVFNQIPSPVDPGLASLPLNSPARAVYSEDFMEGGAYAQLPMGRVGPMHAFSRCPGLILLTIGPLLARWPHVREKGAFHEVISPSSSQNIFTRSC